MKKASTLPPEYQSILNDEFSDEKTPFFLSLSAFPLVLTHRKQFNRISHQNTIVTHDLYPIKRNITDNALLKKKETPKHDTQKPTTKPIEIDKPQKAPATQSNATKKNNTNQIKKIETQKNPQKNKNSKTAIPPAPLTHQPTLPQSNHNTNASTTPSTATPHHPLTSTKPLIVHETVVSQVPQIIASRLTKRLSTPVPSSDEEDENNPNPIIHVPTTIPSATTKIYQNNNNDPPPPNRLKLNNNPPPVWRLKLPTASKKTTPQENIPAPKQQASSRDAPKPPPSYAAQPEEPQPLPKPVVSTAPPPEPIVQAPVEPAVVIVKAASKPVRGIVFPRPRMIFESSDEEGKIGSPESVSAVPPPPPSHLLHRDYSRRSPEKDNSSSFLPPSSNLSYLEQLQSDGKYQRDAEEDDVYHGADFDTLRDKLVTEAHQQKMVNIEHEAFHTAMRMNEELRKYGDLSNDLAFLDSSSYNVTRGGKGVSGWASKLERNEQGKFKPPTLAKKKPLLLLK